jgi:hypothetical protein
VFFSPCKNAAKKNKIQKSYLLKISESFTPA